MNNAIRDTMKDLTGKNPAESTARPAITYYVQRYRPAYEAISKEVQVLTAFFSRHYHIKVHNLHLDGLFSFSWKKEFFSQHFAWYLLTFPRTFLLSRRSSINHIYTSLGDLPYLPVLQLKNTLLTAAASCSFEKMKRRVRYLQKLPVIVVESEKQREQLRSLNLPEEKIKLIYPPVDVEKFYHAIPSFPASSASFTILYASCPTRQEDFTKRGIYLLRETAGNISGVSFLLAWRDHALTKAQKIFGSIPSVRIQNGIASDMNFLYAQAHCTIIPYTCFDDYLKLIPNSALESLAAGKPLLVSSTTEIAAIVQKEKCGVVFEPAPESLCQAIAALKKNYQLYQQNCRRTAEKYFSKMNFLQQYKQVYEKILRA